MLLYSVCIMHKNVSCSLIKEISFIQYTCTCMKKLLLELPLILIAFSRLLFFLFLSSLFNGTGEALQPGLQCLLHIDFTSLHEERIWEVAH